MNNGTVLWPPHDLMLTAGSTLNKIMKGVTPLGDFWMMNKLKYDMDVDVLMKTPASKEILMAAQTINRFKSLTRI